MWVNPEDLDGLAEGLHFAHRQVAGPLDAVAPAVEAAAWRCGAGDEHRRRIAVVLRQVVDHAAVLDGGNRAVTHLAGQARQLLTDMAQARQERLDGLAVALSELAPGQGAGGIRAERADVPPVPDLAWVDLVPAPVPPTFNVAAGSTALPETSSPAGAFSVELEQLEALPAALDAVADGIFWAGVMVSDDVAAVLLRETDRWGLGGGRVAEPLEDAVGTLGLPHCRLAFQDLARETQLAAARIREINDNPAALLFAFGTAEGYQRVDDDLFRLTFARNNPPTDPAELASLLEIARGAGYDASYYAGILEMHWFVQAAVEAGIDIDEWDTSRGAEALSGISALIYAHYGSLALKHPELQWAGLASMVGPGFAGAFRDLEDVGDLMDAIADNPALRAALADDPILGPLVRQGAQFGEEELAFYEKTFLDMQREIFTDMGGLHQAYVDGGMPAITEMYEAGLVDTNTYKAWQDTATYAGMDPDDPAAQALISGINHDFADREQNIVIADDYDAMRNRPLTGEAFTTVATVIGAPSIPGAQGMGTFSPLIVPVRVANVDFGLPDVPIIDVPIWDAAHVDLGSAYVDVRTPFSDRNVADARDRFALIEGDTLPVYEDYIAGKTPEQLREEGYITDDPDVVAARTEQWRSQNRIPELVERVTDFEITGSEVRWGE